MLVELIVIGTSILLEVTVILFKLTSTGDLFVFGVFMYLVANDCIVPSVATTCELCDLFISPGITYLIFNGKLDPILPVLKYTYLVLTLGQSDIDKLLNNESVNVGTSKYISVPGLYVSGSVYSESTPTDWANILVTSPPSNM